MVELANPKETGQSPSKTLKGEVVLYILNSLMTLLIGM